MKNFTVTLWLVIGIIFISQAQSKKGQIDSLINIYTKNGLFSGSVLIVNNNEILISKGYGLANREWQIKNSADTRFRIGSMTKQFTSIITFKLIEQGLLSLDDKVSEYIPYYPKEKGEQIKIKHLLSHTSGLPNYTNQTIPQKTYKREEFIKSFCMGDLRFKPGTRYSYSNTGYYLLGDILERASGMTFEQLLKKYIFSTCGMTQSGVDNGYNVIPHFASSYENSLTGYQNANQKSDDNMASNVFAAGYMYSTIEDMYKWHKALASDVFLKEETKKSALKIIAPLTSAERMKKQNPLLFEVIGSSYIGYMGDIFIQINETSNDSIFCYQHNGGINMYRSHNYHIPSKGRFITVLGNNGSAKGDEMIWKIMQILDDKSPTPPKKSLIITLKKAYKEGGIMLLVKTYEEYRKNKDAFETNERELNSFAYSMVHLQRYKEASEVFRLIAEDYPKSYNAWDSYAETLLKCGDTISSVKYYKQSLELNPDNQSGKIALEKLGVKP